MKITAIRQQVKRPDRYSIYVDEAFAFGLSESALLETGLFVGQELDKPRLDELQATAGRDKLFGNALRFAAMRPRSRWEIQNYLQRKDSTEYADYVILRLERAGLLNDLEFARAWVANRRLLRSTSKRKLQMELQQKRVPSDIIDEVLAEDDTTDQTALQQLIAKKRSRYPDQQKLMAYLARQGFGYDDIKQALAEETE